jgi:hypothetical protein
LPLAVAVPQSPGVPGEFTAPIASRSEHRWSPLVTSSWAVVTEIVLAIAGATPTASSIAADNPVHTHPRSNPVPMAGAIV